MTNKTIERNVIADKVVYDKTRIIKLEISRLENLLSFIHLDMEFALFQEYVEAIKESRRIVDESLKEISKVTRVHVLDISIQKALEEQCSRVLELNSVLKPYLTQYINNEIN